jgi:5-methylcytosine-specific restriction endonuclease McrA
VPDRIKLWRPPRAAGRIKKSEGRPNAYRRGYCDKRHFAWRKAVLVRDGYICRDCGRVCSDKRQAHADHIVPVKLRPDLRYELSNGACRCAGCHTLKTMAER